MNTGHLNLFASYHYDQDPKNYLDCMYRLSLVLAKSTTAYDIFLDLINVSNATENKDMKYHFDLKLEALKQVAESKSTVTFVSLQASNQYRQFLETQEIQDSVELVLEGYSDLIIVSVYRSSQDVLIKELRKKHQDWNFSKLSWGYLHYNLSLIEDNVIIDDYLKNFNSLPTNLLASLSLAQALELPNPETRYLEIQKVLRNAILDYYEILLTSQSLNSVCRRKITEAKNEIYQLDLQALRSISVLNSNLTHDDYFDSFEVNFDDEHLYIDILAANNPKFNRFYEEVCLQDLWRLDYLEVLDQKFDFLLNPLLVCAGATYDPVDILTPDQDYDFKTYISSLNEFLSLNRPVLSQSTFIDEEDKKQMIKYYQGLDEKAIIFDKDALLELIEERLGHNLIYVNPALHIRLTLPFENLESLEQSIGELILLGLQELFTL